MEEEFDEWNGQKKSINSIVVKAYPQEGDVWSTVLGKNIGSEHKRSKI
jgi:hypothetical protein